MAFCCNCGKELAAGAKFCFECGTPVGKNDETVRRTVYSGEIHKCPSCGEVLQSMTAICPACGHELNSAKLASALKEFIDEIKPGRLKFTPEKPSSVKWRMLPKPFFRA